MEKRLWDMVNGANTVGDVLNAEKAVNAADIDVDVWEALMSTLAYISREVYRES